jgi:hypothetical protein
MYRNSVCRRASEAVIWLGEEDDSSRLAFDVFDVLPKDESMHWDPAADPSLSEFYKTLNILIL